MHPRRVAPRHKLVEEPFKAAGVDHDHGVGDLPHHGPIQTRGGLELHQEDGLVDLHDRDVAMNLDVHGRARPRGTIANQAA